MGHIFPCNEHNHSARSAHRLSLPAHPIWHLSTNIFLQQSFPLHTIDNLLALPLCFNNHHLEQQRNHLIEAAPRQRPPHYPPSTPPNTHPPTLPIPPRLPLRPRQILRRLLQNWHKEHLHHLQEPFLVTRRSSQSRVINPL